MRASHFIALVALAACDKGKVDPPKPTPTPTPTPDPVPAKLKDLFVRACNDTGKQLEKVQWIKDEAHVTPNWTFNEPSLPSGWCTAYRLADNAHAYTHVSFFIGKTEYSMLPVNNVKPSSEPGQHWSYHLTTLDSAKHTIDAHIESDLQAQDAPSQVRVCNDSRSEVELRLPGNVRKPGLEPQTCSDYWDASAVDFSQSFLVGTTFLTFTDLGPDPWEGERLPPGRWTYHLTKLEVIDSHTGGFSFEWKPEPN